MEDLRRCTVAVDMGASRTRVYLKGVGLAVDEPSVAAVNSYTSALIAVGAAAEQMAGRTPAHIRVVRPVSSNGITDIDMAQRILRYLLDVKVRRAWRFNPFLRAAACTPHDAQPLTRHAIIDTLAGLGARKVLLVDTLIAAAVGSGLAVSEPEGTLMVVCGSTMTQIAVLSMGNVVAAQKVPVGGEAVDRALMEHLRIRHGLALSARSVQQMNLDVSVAAGDSGPDSTPEVTGRDVLSGMRRSVPVDAAAMRQVANAPLVSVLDGIRSVLRSCPPDLVSDIGERGLVLAGGSATLPGLEPMLRDETGLPVHIAERPEVCAVLGLGSMIEKSGKPLPDSVLAGGLAGVRSSPSPAASEAVSDAADDPAVTPGRGSFRYGWRRAARSRVDERDRATAKSG